MNIKPLIGCLKSITKSASKICKHSPKEYVTIAPELKSVSADVFEYMSKIKPEIEAFAKSKKVKINISPRPNYEKYAKATGRCEFVTVLGPHEVRYAKSKDGNDIILTLMGTRQSRYKKCVNSGAMDILDLNMKYAKKVKCKTGLDSCFDTTKVDSPFVMYPPYEQTKKPFAEELLSFLKNMSDSLNRKNII